jgi:formylglycine-generating enzyme required for sulfatase activity
MAGNVREWCRDPWGIYLSKEQVNPSETPEEDNPDTYYVIRGGSYETTTETARATWRSKDGISGTAYIMKTDEHQTDLGFRVVLEVMECPKDLGTSSETTARRETGR